VTHRGPCQPQTCWDSVWPHLCQVQGPDPLPAPAGHPIPDPSQAAVGLLAPLGTLLAPAQPAVDQHPQVLLHRAALQPPLPQPAAPHGVGVTRGHLALLNLGPSLQPVQTPLQSLPPLEQIDTPASFSRRTLWVTAPTPFLKTGQTGMVSPPDGSRPSPEHPCSVSKIAVTHQP